MSLSNVNKSSCGRELMATLKAMVRYRAHPSISANSYIHSGSIANPALSRLSHERSGSAERAMSGMKTETNQSQSPALNAIPNGTGEARQSPSAPSSQMPPPTHLSSRMPSGSPHPQTTSNGVAPTSQAPNTPFNSRLRQPGKGNLLVLLQQP